MYNVPMVHDTVLLKGNNSYFQARKDINFCQLHKHKKVY